MVVGLVGLVGLVALLLLFLTVLVFIFFLAFLCWLLALRIERKASDADAKNLELVNMSKTPSIAKLKKGGRGKKKKKASVDLDVPGKGIRFVVCVAWVACTDFGCCFFSTAVAGTEEQDTSGTNIENPMTNMTGAAVGGAAEGMASDQWKTHRDKNSGKDYYSNTDNGRVTWTQHDKLDDK